MTQIEEIVAIAGLGVAIVANSVAVGLAFGKLSGAVKALVGEVRDIKQVLMASGDNALIRRSELGALIDKAEGEHGTMNTEITVLRATTIEHGQQLAEHSARLGALEEGR